LNTVDPSTYFASLIRRDPEFKEMVYTKHPYVDGYDDSQKTEVIKEMINHPRFRAEMAKARNEAGAIPSRPTASRTMRPEEQHFLTLAFRRLQESFQRNPFHIHGETAIVGEWDGRPRWMKYFPTSEAQLNIGPGDKFNLHTHPPFIEPFTSSASEADHRAAALVYWHENMGMDTFVTNGKDVMHIPPDSTELIKLVPDPEVEKQLGNFPVAFKLDPQQPPRPFSNPESPATFRPWEYPESWNNPEW
jgi:hypothetical protein